MMNTILIQIAIGMAVIGCVLCTIYLGLRLFYYVEEHKTVGEWLGWIIFIFAIILISYLIGNIFYPSH